MKIVIIEDNAEVAGSNWKKGTLLEAPDREANKACDAKLATDDPDAIAKAEKAAVADAEKKSAKDSKSTEDKK